MASATRGAVANRKITPNVPMWGRYVERGSAIPTLDWSGSNALVTFVA
jgi:hypothetical protein